MGIFKNDDKQSSAFGFDESKINWQELEDRWGVKRDNLEKSGHAVGIGGLDYLHQDVLHVSCFLVFVVLRYQ